MQVGRVRKAGVGMRVEAVATHLCCPSDMLVAVVVVGIGVGVLGVVVVVVVVVIVV